MKKFPVFVLLLLVMIVLLAVMVSGACAQDEPAAQNAPGPDVMSVRDLVPFSAQANYMSLPGVLRWSGGMQMSRLEAVRAVKAQGCDPTVTDEDVLVLTGRLEPSP